MNIPESFRPKKSSDSKLEGFLTPPELESPLKDFRDVSLKTLHSVFEDYLPNFEFFFNIEFLNDYKETREMYEFFDSELSSQFKHYAPFTMDCLLFCDSFFRSKHQLRHNYEVSLNTLVETIGSLADKNACIDLIDILDRARNTNRRFFNIYMEDFFRKVYAKLLEDDLKEPAEHAIRAIIFPYIYQGSKKSRRRKKYVDTHLRPYISKFGYCDTCLDKSSEIIHYLLKSEVAYHVKEVSNVLKGIYMH